MRNQPTVKPVNTSLHFIIIVAVSSLVLFTNLGGPRLWDRDEPRNAGCAAEMMERGDWVVPFFNAELRHHKPILLYWLLMSAYGVFGVNEFSARFWSAALAVGTVLATYGIGRRLFHANVGFWAAVILATSLMFDVAGRAATPDSALIFCSTAALLIYVLTAFPADGTYFPQRWWAAGAMYALMGLAVLAKGPIGRYADRRNRDVLADRAAAGNCSGGSSARLAAMVAPDCPPIFALSISSAPAGRCGR